MKLLKRSLALLLLTAVLGVMMGCYVVSGQKMDKLKGTYKLAYYTRTPQYERRNGYTGKTYNYIEDETLLYEDYLIVTGTGTGYYVHKDANTPAYAKEITLSYQYNAEKSSAVDYVVYNDALTVNSDSGINRLGVNQNTLNYTKAAFDYTELFTGREMRSEEISVRWEKVDKATDLSYAEKQLGTLKTYDYRGFGVRGIYELGAPVDIASGTVLESDYQYFYYVIETAQNGATATAYYALKDAPTEQVVTTVTLVESGEDWNEITVDGVTWTVDPGWSTYYYSETAEQKQTLTCVSHDISAQMLESLVESRLPAVAE